MAADIYTKTFPERTKWERLCKQINVIDRFDLKTKELFMLRAMVLESSVAKYRRVPKPGDLSPEELERLSGVPGLGWHTLNDDVSYMVCREPKIMRECSDPDRRYRSTWLKTTEGWKRIENKVL